MADFPPQREALYHIRVLPLVAVREPRPLAATLHKEKTGCGALDGCFCTLLALVYQDCNPPLLQPLLLQMT